MTKGTVPVGDRAGLSTRARDHLHHPKTDFHALDYLSMAVDAVVCVAALTALWALSVLSAFGVVEPGACLPQALAGPPKYEAAMWIVLSLCAAAGLAGLLQFWLRRIWEKTYGSKTSLWNGTLASQLLLGAVMPAVCAVILVRDGAATSMLTGLFVVMALLHARHAVQVQVWARR